MSDFLLNGRVNTGQITADIVESVVRATRQITSKGINVPIGVKTDSIKQAAGAFRKTTTAINALNKKLGALTRALNSSAKIGASPKKFATGGFVRGSGSRDNVRALLTPGEYVLNRSQVRALGRQNLQRFERGGSAKSKPPGTGATRTGKRGRRNARKQQRYTAVPTPGALAAITAATGENRTRTTEMKSKGHKLTKRLREQGPWRGFNIDSIQPASFEVAKINGGIQAKIKSFTHKAMRKAANQIENVLRAKMGKPSGRNEVEQKLARLFKNKIDIDEMFGGKAVAGQIFEMSVSKMMGLFAKKKGNQDIDFTNVNADSFKKLWNLKASTRAVDAKLTDAAGSDMLNKAVNYHSKGGPGMFRLQRLRNFASNQKALGKAHDLSSTEDKLLTLLSGTGRNAEFARQIRDSAGGFLPKAGSALARKNSSTSKLFENMTNRDAASGRISFKEEFLRRNSGGFVPGLGDRDTVPALLTPGEFVINKRSANILGMPRLKRLNRAHMGGRIGRYARGGRVQRFSNGGGVSGGRGAAAGTAGLQANATQIVQLNKQMEALNANVSQGADFFNVFGDSIVKSTIRMAAFGVGSRIMFGVTDAIRSSIAQIISMNQAMTNLNKIFQLSVGELNSFKSSLLGLAKDFGVSVEKITEATTIFVQQGLSIKETLEATKASILAVNAANLSFSDATELITVSVNSFGLAFEDATSVIDKLTTIADSSAASVNDLTQILRRSGAAAATAGLTLEEFAAITATVRESTRLSSTTIGAGMKTILVGVQQNEKALNKYGIEVRKSNGEMIGTMDIIGKIATRWETLSREQKVNLAATIAGKRRFTEFASIMNNFGKAQDLVALSANSAGNAQAKQAQQLETIATSMNRLQSSIIDIVNSIGEAGGEALIKDLVDVAKDVVSVFGVITKVFTAIPGALPTAAIVAFFKIFEPKIAEISVGAKEAVKGFFNIGDVSKKSASVATNSLEGVKQTLDATTNSANALASALSRVTDTSLDATGTPNLTKPIPAMTRSAIDATVPSEVADKNNNIQARMKDVNELSKEATRQERALTKEIGLQLNRREKLGREATGQHKTQLEINTIAEDQERIENRINDLSAQKRATGERIVELDGMRTDLSDTLVKNDDLLATSAKKIKRSKEEEEAIAKRRVAIAKVMVFLAISATEKLAGSVATTNELNGQFDSLSHKVRDYADAAQKGAVAFQLMSKFGKKTGLVAGAVVGIVSAIRNRQQTIREGLKKQLKFTQDRLAVLREIENSAARSIGLQEKRNKLVAEENKIGLKTLAATIAKENVERNKRAREAMPSATIPILNITSETEKVLGILLDDTRKITEATRDGTEGIINWSDRVQAETKNIQNSFRLLTSDIQDGLGSQIAGFNKSIDVMHLWEDAMMIAAATADVFNEHGAQSFGGERIAAATALATAANLEYQSALTKTNDIILGSGTPLKKAELLSDTYRRTISRITKLMPEMGQQARAAAQQLVNNLVKAQQASDNFKSVLESGVIASIIAMRKGFGDLATPEAREAIDALRVKFVELGGSVEDFAIILAEHIGAKKLKELMSPFMKELLGAEKRLESFARAAERTKILINLENIQKGLELHRQVATARFLENDLLARSIELEAEKNNLLDKRKQGLTKIADISQSLADFDESMKKSSEELGRELQKNIAIEATKAFSFSAGPRGVGLAEKDPAANERRRELLRQKSLLEASQISVGLKNLESKDPSEVAAITRSLVERKKAIEELIVIKEREAKTDPNESLARIRGLEIQKKLVDQLIEAGIKRLKNMQEMQKVDFKKLQFEYEKVKEVIEKQAIKIQIQVDKQKFKDELALAGRNFVQELSEMSRRADLQFSTKVQLAGAKGDEKKQLAIRLNALHQETRLQLEIAKERFFLQKKAIDNEAHDQLRRVKVEKKIALMKLTEQERFLDNTETAANVWKEVYAEGYRLTLAQKAAALDLQAAREKSPFRQLVLEAKAQLTRDKESQVKARKVTVDRDMGARSRIDEQSEDARERIMVAREQKLSQLIQKTAFDEAKIKLGASHEFRDTIFDAGKSFVDHMEQAKESFLGDDLAGTISNLMLAGFSAIIDLVQPSTAEEAAAKDPMAMINQAKGLGKFFEGFSDAGPAVGGSDLPAGTLTEPIYTKSAITDFPVDDFSDLDAGTVTPAQLQPDAAAAAMGPPSTAVTGFDAQGASALGPSNIGVAGGAGGIPGLSGVGGGFMAGIGPTAQEAGKFFQSNFDPFFENIGDVGASGAGAVLGKNFKKEFGSGNEQEVGKMAGSLVGGVIGGFLGAPQIGATIGSFVGSAIGGVIGGRSKRKKRRRQRRQQLLQDMGTFELKLGGVAEKAFIANLAMEKFIEGLSNVDQINALRTNLVSTLETFEKFNVASKDRAEAVLKFAQATTNLLKDELSKIRSLGQEGFNIGIDDMIKTRLGKQLAKTIARSPSAALGVSFIPEMAGALQAGLKVIQFTDPKLASSVQKTTSAVGLMKLGVVDSLSEGMDLQTKFEDQLLASVKLSNFFLKVIALGERGSMLRGGKGSDRGFAVRSGLATQQELDIADIGVGLSSLSDVFGKFNLGFAARGTLSGAEIGGLINAARQEKRLMPSGSRLMVANDSETIMTRRQARRILGRRGRVGNAANGNVSGGVGFDDLNINLKINNDKTVRLSGINQLSREATKALEDKMGQTVDREEFEAVRRVLDSVIFQLKDRRILGAV